MINSEFSAVKCVLKPGIAGMRAVLLLSVFLAACGGSGGSRDNQAGFRGSNAGTDCTGNCADAGVALTAADVRQILGQAVEQAKALNTVATIAVSDRVGNILAVYRMNNVVTPGRHVQVISNAGGAPIQGGLERLELPVSANQGSDGIAAIAKAVTGAYLSSEGNGFSTRIANQIVQRNFNPGEQNRPSGPLFGVQFSQLACSDFISSGANPADTTGPKRSPLGLSADPGGFGLYKNGTPVGGIGVISGDFRYTLDNDLADQDRDTDELIALAGTVGFAVPADRQGDRITVDGKVLRYSDVDFGDLAGSAISAAPVVLGVDGDLLPIKDYFDAGGGIRAGVAFGQAASGIRADGDVLFPGRDAFVFVDSANQNRFPPTAGSNLSAAQVQALLDRALEVANSARAQIRRPLSTPARVTISVVDTDGTILGMARTRDAPIFGADVSLQKARTATLFSSRDAADFIESLPDAQYLGPDLTRAGTVDFDNYVRDAIAFTRNSRTLRDGTAFSDRAGGNLSRPNFPDGKEDRPHGPFSKPAGEWSPFSTGLQLDLSYNAIISHLLYLFDLNATDIQPNCAGYSFGATASTLTLPRAGNGLQIFPGSVPIYRGNTLVGGIGVSGDGVDQDDMIAFLAVHRVGQDLGSVNNAPPAIRADNIVVDGVRLRYVSCPQAPFIGSDEQLPCNDK